jgi:hypothetical protein
VVTMDERERNSFVGKCRELREAVGQLFRILFPWVEPLMQRLERWLDLD